MDWDDLQVFLAATEHHTLTAAARSLGLSQATASRRVARLEEQLGQVLFERSRTGLVATPAARALLPHAEAMAASARQAMAAVQGVRAEPAGRVRLAAPPGVAVDLATVFLPRLRQSAPKVELELLSSTHLLDLSRHEADLAIRSTAPTAGDLVCRTLSPVRLGAYASPSLLARKLAPGELPWVQWSDSLSHLSMARTIARMLDGRPPALVSDSILVLRAGCAAGIGCMLMPAWQAQLAGLVQVELPGVALPSVPVYIVGPGSLWRLPRVKVVVEALTELIAELQ